MSFFELIFAFKQFVKMVVNPGTPIGLFINFIILLVSIVAVVKILRLALSLYQETQTLRNVRTNVDKMRANEQVVNPAKTPEEVAQVFSDLMKGVGDKSLVYGRARSLMRLRHVSQTTAGELSKVSEDEAQIRLSSPRYMATVPILLGLIGTLWGLSMAVTEIQPIISEIKNIEHLRQVLDALTNTISGMKTAFTTSIAGLLAGLFLTLLTTLISRMYQRVLKDLNNLANLELVPLLTVSEEARNLAALSESLRASSDRIQNATKNMETWTSGLLSAVRESRSGQDKMFQVSKNFDEGMTKLLNYQQDYQDKLLKQNDIIESTLNKVTESAANVIETHDKLEKIIDKIKENYEATGKIIDEAEKQRDLDQNEFEQKLEDIVAEFRKVSEDVRKHNPEEVANAIRKIIDTSRQPFIDFFDSVNLSVTDMVKKMTDKVLAEQSRMVENLRTIGVELSSRFSLQDESDEVSGGDERIGADRK